MFKHGLRNPVGGALLALLGLCHGSPRAAAAPRAVVPTAAAATAPAPTAAASTAPAPAAAAPTAAAATAAPTPTAAATTAPLPPVPAPIPAAQVIQVLDQTVDWYRTLGLQQQTATQPSDLLILYDNRQTANKVMALAFDIARADADLLGKEPRATQAAGGDGAISSQVLSQLRKKLDAQAAAVQSELDARRREIAADQKKSKVQVQAKINELQGELDLISTKKNIIGTMTEFATGADDSSAGALKAQIDAMAVAVPAVGVPPATTGPAATAAATPQSQALLGPVNSASSVGSFGLWELASNAFRLSEKAATITSIDRRTAALQATLARIRTPLLDRMKALSSRGDALAAQADSADSTTLNGVHDELGALAEQFKQVSSLLIPLSREGTLLSQYRRNLSNWHDVVDTQYRDALKTLGIRLGMVLIVLAVLFGAAELWRRMVLRYIQDSRRRYQLLLLRRIALWALVVVVIGLSFASELGSIVTFAGLITAGIAVAMQSVLVSIVGYFFLIGKYGIRVGDRVQIGEVAGEVIDLGLVRMYLMELGAKGAMGPTGRVVAFANSVVFQVSSGLFKQMPGVNFSWREITLALPPGANTADIKEKLIAAVTDALKDYRAEILRQTKEVARTMLSSSAGDAQPQVQLRFSAAGVEAHVRYPVHLQHAAEIDERVTEALANVISNVAPPAGAGLPAHSG